VKAMLAYHSFNLLQVRRHVLSQKMLILRTYLYLRDAKAKAFYHEYMTKGLWDHAALLTEQVLRSPLLQSPMKEPLQLLRRRRAVQSSVHITKVPPCIRTLDSTQQRKFAPPLTCHSQREARKAAGMAVANHKENGGHFLEFCQTALE
jgi:hypothetical protein